MLRVHEVHKTFFSGEAPIHVLRGASFEVAPGEAVAMVGPSGVGKSTLLHLVAGLDKPDSGAILVDGRDVTSLRGGERDRFRREVIGIVYQFHFLLPEFTALENVMLPAVIAGDGKGARARAHELLESVGLAGRASHTPARLSGGEQQRVAIARALVNRPRLLLADEPTGNLDEETARSAFDLLFRLKVSHGLTILMATHNAEMAAACDRIIHLHEGRAG